MSAATQFIKPKGGKELPSQGDIDKLMECSISLAKAVSPHSEALHSASSKPICHGRVRDLGGMVPTQWWKSVFADAMYLKTDGDVCEDPEITQGEIALLLDIPDIRNIIMRGRMPDDPPAKILDLCCGQGRHSLYLAKEYPHLIVHGHDQSSYLISLAQERASFQSVTTQTFFTVGDCRQIPYPESTFDLVLLLGNSFGYFADDDGDRAVLDEIMRVMAPGGRLVLDLTDGDFMKSNFAERSWEWVDDTTFVCRERQLDSEGLRLISREIITVASKGVVRDQFYQERLYSKAELHGLIMNAGLLVDGQKVEAINDGIITIGYDLSKRKEDLGMMEQRMMVMASKAPISSTGTAICSPTPLVAKTPSSVVNPSLTSHTPLSSSESTEDSLETAVHSSSASTTLAQHKQPFTSSGPFTRHLAKDLVINHGLAARGPQQPPPFSEITVLLGDPSIPCIGKLNNTWNKEDLATREKLVQALYDLGYSKSEIVVVDRHANLASQLTERRPLFVFNLCDEGYVNDALKEMHVPALLEMLDIPYSGAGPNCLAFCYDKGLVNGSSAALGVPIAREATYLGAVATPALPDLSKLDQLIQERISYPAFIKPIKGDNSLGITSRSIVHNRDELAAYLEELSSLQIRDVLVQEYLAGTEYGIGMVGNLETGFHFFPILEVDFSKIIQDNLPPILGFESKWDPSSPYWTNIGYKRAVLSESVENQLKSYAIVLWERFGCRDYARFDFRCDVGSGNGFDALGGTIKLLEVNPNPGWCWDGKFAYMAKLDGFEYKDMLRMILQAAWDRISKK
eukprot:jgi/Hompol1/1818/HPOL_003485-RA